MKRKATAGLILTMLFFVSMFPLSIFSGVGLSLVRAESASGLVGYWNLDQGSGAIASDSSGYNNLGTIYGASWTNGKINGALNFDGLDDYIDCGNSATLDPTEGATIEAWVNFNELPSDAGHVMEIASRSGGGTDLDLQCETDNEFKFFIGTGAPNFAVSSTVVEANKWYHIAGTYQAGDSVKIYVNGVLEQVTTIIITRNTNPNKFCIGQSGYWSERFFNGKIDEVKLYSRALSAEEIEAEYIHVSISPSSDAMDIGQSQQFTSTISGGISPYAYQWYSNGAAINGATSSTYQFTSTSRGSYNICVKVIDTVGIAATSNNATVTVNNEPSVTISPTSVTVESGSQQFTSSVTEGTSPYTYQWYLNDVPVSGATSDTWTFTPTTNGTYTIHVSLTDSTGVSAISSVSNVEVRLSTQEPQPFFISPLFFAVPLVIIVLLIAVIVYRRRSQMRRPQEPIRT